MVLQQPENTKKTSSEKRLYWIIFGFGVISGFIALIAGLLANEEANSRKIWLQLLTATVVFAYVLIFDIPFLSRKFSNKAWVGGAIIICGTVFAFSTMTGLYLNILQVPLILAAGQRLDNGRLIVYLSTLASIILAAAELIFWLTGWNKAQPDIQIVAPVIVTLSSLGLTLVLYMGRQNLVIDHYKQEAESKASEMKIAHEIQSSLMPPNTITTDNWTMVARSVPAQEVGGDFYEYIPYLNKIGGIAVGDVAGKGIPAALQMAVVRTVFRIEARRRIFPSETIYSVNTALQAERGFGMVTMLYAFVDPTTNTLHLANAGHNYPIIINGRLEEVAMPGLPLGIAEGVEYEERRIKIAPGTKVVFYTDGVVEAINVKNEMYGFDRFRETIKYYQHYETHEMIDRLFHAISDFTAGAPQSDDITIVVLQYLPVTAKTDPEDQKRDLELMFSAANPLKNSDKSASEKGMETESINWI